MDKTNKREEQGKELSLGGSRQAVSRFLKENGLDGPRSRNADGQSALHVAASEGERFFMSGLTALLVHAGADLDARDRFGSTPLMAAAQTGNSGIRDELLALGADPLLSNDSGETVFSLTKQWQKPDGEAKPTVVSDYFSKGVALCFVARQGHAGGTMELEAKAMAREAMKRGANVGWEAPANQAEEPSILSSKRPRSP